jgi:hypothetical protein
VKLRAIYRKDLRTQSQNFPGGRMASRSVLLPIVVTILLAGVLGASREAQEAAPPEVSFPRNDVGLTTLAAREQAQLESVDQFKVFYQFHFTDQLKQSGISRLLS